MNVFIFFELLSFIIIGANFLIGYATSYVKLLPTLIVVVYILLSNKFLKKNCNSLKATLFLSFIADIFFIIFKIPVLGVGAFITIQLCNLFYLRKINNLRLLILFPIFNLLIYMIFGNKIMIFEIILYGLLSITNLFISYRKIKIDHLPKYFFLALIFLFVCDLNIVLIKGFSLNSFIYKLFSIVEWSCYILYLTIITKMISYDFQYFSDSKYNYSTN